MSRLALLAASLVIVSCTDDVDLGHPGTMDAGVVVLPSGARLSRFASAGAGIYALATDDTHLYWVENGQFDGVASLRRMPLAGGAIETLHAEPGRIRALALDATDVYITHSLLSSGRILRVPKGGGAPTVLDTRFISASLVVDDAYVYYSHAAAPGGSIWRIAKSGGVPEQVASDVAGLEGGGLAVDGEHVYCAQTNPGRILRFDKRGSAPEVVAEVGVGTVWLAIDDDDVYFSACPTVDCTPVDLYRVAKSGGPTELISEVPLNVEGRIAVANGAIVWGNWWRPVGGELEQVLMVSQSSPSPLYAMGVAALPGQAFLGDFYSGDIYQLRWNDDPL